MKKLLSLTLALATLSATCYAEQPKAADYRNIMSSGNYYVEYEYNYAKKILAVQNGKRMDYTMLQSQPNTALAYQSAFCNCRIFRRRRKESSEHLVSGW